MLLTLNELKDKILELGGSLDDKIHFMTSLDVCGDGEHSYYGATKAKVKQQPHILYKERVYNSVEDFKANLGDDIALDNPSMSDEEIDKEIEEYIFRHAIDINPSIVVYLDV
jgi:hypothetical protein